MNPANITFSPREDKKAVEENRLLAPKFDVNGLIPAVAMDAETKQPLMLAYMNEQALKMTIELKEAVYYSRSRNEIWHKGATSGHVQKVKEILTDCDQDAIILYVEQIGAGACHTGRSGCFYRAIDLSESEKTDQPVALNFTETDLTFDPSSVYSNK